VKNREILKLWNRNRFSRITVQFCLSTLLIFYRKPYLAMYMSCRNITSRYKNKEIKTVVRGSCFIYVISINYVYWCTTRFKYQMMLVSFRSSTTGATSGAGTVYRSRASVFTSVFFLHWGGGSTLLSLYCSLVFCRWCLFFSHSSIYGF
jgi:hypothetical protein